MTYKSFGDLPQHIRKWIRDCFLVDNFDQWAKTPIPALGNRSVLHVINKNGGQTRIIKYLMHQERKVRTKRKTMNYVLRFFRRKPGANGTSKNCFEVVYTGIMPSLAKIKKLLAVRHPSSTYRATGYAISKEEETVTPPEQSCVEAS